MNLHTIPVREFGGGRVKDFTIVEVNIYWKLVFALTSKLVNKFTYLILDTILIVFSLT